MLLSSLHRLETYAAILQGTFCSQLLTFDLVLSGWSCGFFSTHSVFNNWPKSQSHKASFDLLGHPSFRGTWWKYYQQLCHITVFNVKLKWNPSRHLRPALVWVIFSHSGRLVDGFDVLLPQRRRYQASLSCRGWLKVLGEKGWIHRVHPTLTSASWAHELGSEPQRYSACSPVWESGEQLVFPFSGPECVHVYTLHTIYSFLPLLCTLNKDSSKNICNRLV